MGLRKTLVSKKGFNFEILFAVSRCRIVPVEYVVIKNLSSPSFIKLEDYVNQGF